MRLARKLHCRTTPRRPLAGHSWCLAGCWLSIVGCTEAPEPADRTHGAEPPTGTPATAESASAAHPSPSPPPLDAGAEATGPGSSPPTDPWPPALADPPAVSAGADRIYSKIRLLWIHPKPAPTKSWIGYLSLGDSVRVKGGSAAQARIDEGATDGRACQQWYAIEPRGYVCAGDQATLDASDPLVVELSRAAAKPDSPWPYHYGESLFTPVYPKVPTAAEQRRAEPGLQQHLDRVQRAREAESPDERAALAPDLVGVPLEPAGMPAPPAVELHPLGRAIQTRVFPGSTIAYTARFDAAGRTWLRTWDWGVVPQDRVRPYPESAFQGVALGADRSLPLAFFRERPRPKYRRGGSGGMSDSGERWPRQGWVGLTGQGEQVAGARYLETTEPGIYCLADDATVIERAPRLPPNIDSRTSGRRSWLDISVLGGWLVAYEGAVPVYATLISPGRGGVPYPNIDPIETASTPVGQFTVTGKFLTATMVSSSDANVVHAEVQYTQNFSGPHALHGAYWHDDWGEKKSGGCVNLSPIDARRVFAWTEPELPPGWHGMRWRPGMSDSTVIRIHR